MGKVVISSLFSSEPVHFILNFSFTRIVVRRLVLKISIEIFNAYINYIVFRVANQGPLLASSLKFVYGTKNVFEEGKHQLIA